MLSLKVDFKVEGARPKGFIEALGQSFSKPILNKHLNKVRTDVLNDLQEFIQAHRKRKFEEHTEDWRETARNNLFNTIKASTDVKDIGGSEIRLGIGYISYLTKHAPYWQIVNYGGIIQSGPIFGKFDGGFGYSKPMGDMRGGMQTFQKSYNGQYLMKPMKPIPPMYYIERMKYIFAQSVMEVEKTMREDIARAKLHRAIARETGLEKLK
jgi:hypothetical protein